MQAKLRASSYFLVFSSIFSNNSTIRSIFQYQIAISRMAIKNTPITTSTKMTTIHSPSAI